MDVQLAKMEQKVKAGAEYFQTQGVYEPEKFIKFMEKAKQFGVPVQLGIIIPKNVGLCRYMNANVAGVHVPDEMIEELQKIKKKQKAGITVWKLQPALSENARIIVRVFILWH